MAWIRYGLLFSLVLNRIRDDWNVSHWIDCHRCLFCRWVDTEGVRLKKLQLLCFYWVRFSIVSALKQCRLGPQLIILELATWIQVDSLCSSSSFLVGSFLVLQIDLVPTISLLFGLPIPKNSLGVVIEDVLNLFPGLCFRLNCYVV